MKLLLFGANGQVGWELQRSLSVLGAITALTRQDADFAHPAALASIVRAIEPDVIVNAAAYNAVDQAEREVELCTAVNAQAPRVLAEEAAAIDAWLVHYSTDQVFDGSASLPYSEDAATGPLSVYGHSKLEGEHHVRASGCKHLIFRTSWVHSPRRDNFALRLLKQAAEQETIDMVADQHATPTGADLLADITAHAVRACLSDASLGATYHAVAAGEASRLEYARLVLDWARDHGMPTRVSSETLRAVTSTEFPSPARRPLNGRLSPDKLCSTFGITLPPWRDGVHRMLAEARLA
jgi:dTDP-4-dehydrorhamnose reductase